MKRVADLVRVVSAIDPDEYGAGTVNGGAIDLATRDFQGAVVFARTGDIEGSPSATSVEVKLQESDDATAWADIDGATATITAAQTGATIRVDQPQKRYLRAVLTVSFTGGTSPNVAVAAVAVLGTALHLPAA